MGVVMKQTTFAGIDVSAKELIVCTQVNNEQEKLNSFDNTDAGHTKLI